MARLRTWMISPFVNRGNDRSGKMRMPRGSNSCTPFLSRSVSPSAATIFPMQLDFDFGNGCFPGFYEAKIASTLSVRMHNPPILARLNPNLRNIHELN